MAMFQFDTAFMLEAIAFAAGLTLIHFGRAGAAFLLRAAGWVLVVAALGTAACSTYFGIRYHVQGEFDHAYGIQASCPMHDGHAGMMHPMHGAMRGAPMLRPPPAAAPKADDDAEQSPAD